jgi:hypothetical protein
VFLCFGTQQIRDCQTSTVQYIFMWLKFFSLLLLLLLFLYSQYLSPLFVGWISLTKHDNVSIFSQFCKWRQHRSKIKLSSLWHWPLFMKRNDVNCNSLLDVIILWKKYESIIPCSVCWSETSHNWEIFR